MADRYTVITEEDWSDDERPEIRIKYVGEGLECKILVGGHEVIDLTYSDSVSPGELIETLKGFRDIFSDAIEALDD